MSIFVIKKHILVTMFSNPVILMKAVTGLQKHILTYFRLKWKWSNLQKITFGFQTVHGKACQRGPLPTLWIVDLGDGRHLKTVTPRHTPRCCLNWWSDIIYYHS